MLLLALSCLQGRPMRAAAEELLALGPEGLQLTPGNAPTSGFLVREMWRPWLDGVMPESESGDAD